MYLFQKNTTTHIDLHQLIQIKNLCFVNGSCCGMTGAFCAYYLNGGRACLHVFFIWKHDVIVLYLRYVHLWCTVQGLLSDDISFFRCVNQIFFFCIRVIYDRDSVHALCKLLLIIRFSQVFCYEIALSEAILKVAFSVRSASSF